MSTTDSVIFDGLFGTSRTRPARTYSHKGANSAVRSKLLPKLKPEPFPRVHKRYRVEGSPEDQLGDQPLVANDDAFHPEGVILSSDVSGRHEQEIPQSNTPTQAVEYDGCHDYYDQDASDSDQLQYHDEMVSSRDLPEEEYDDYNDSHNCDGPRTVVERTPRNPNTPAQEKKNHSGGHAPGTGSIPRLVRSVRRRSFLIFNKSPTESTKFKKLERKKQSDANNNDKNKRKKSNNYNPGDGFSDSEARPNGLFQLTKRKKLHFSVPAVGILDLTQAPAPSLNNPSSAGDKPSIASQPKEQRIILKRKKRVRDNSFWAPTPKEARRDRDHGQEENKDNEAENENEGHQSSEKQEHVLPETQATIAVEMSVPYGLEVSSSVQGEMTTTPNDGERKAGIMNQTLKRDGDIPIEKNRNPNPDGHKPEANISIPVSAKVCNDKVDNNSQTSSGSQVIVPYSDFFLPDTPPPPRAKSLPPVDEVTKAANQPSFRTFRRVKTN